MGISEFLNFSLKRHVRIHERVLCGYASDLTAEQVAMVTCHRGCTKSNIRGGVARSPYYNIFTNIGRRLRELGSFQITRRDAEQEHSVCTPEKENLELQRFAISLSTSERSVAAILCIRHVMAQAM